MRRPLFALLVVAMPVTAEGKAYFAPRDKMVTKADVIAIVEITAVKEVQICRNQEAVAKVERMLKGQLGKEVTFLVPNFFPCAITSVSKGRYLVFLKKEDRKRRGYDLAGSNWRFSYRPIVDGMIEWYANGKSLTLETKELGKVLSEITRILTQMDALP